jgi:hypothetical protein
MCAITLSMVRISTCEPHSLGPVGENGAGSVRMGEDEETVGGVGDGDFLRVVCALGSLAASGGRFHHHKWSIGPKRGMDAIVTHGLRFGISSRSSALRTALQNGISSPSSIGQMPSEKTLPASSRPPLIVLNHVWPCD